MFKQIKNNILIYVVIFLCFLRLSIVEIPKIIAANFITLEEIVTTVDIITIVLLCNSLIIKQKKEKSH